MQQAAPESTAHIAYAGLVYSIAHIDFDAKEDEDKDGGPSANADNSKNEVMIDDREMDFVIALLAEITKRERERGQRATRAINNDWRNSRWWACGNWFLRLAVVTCLAAVPTKAHCA